MTGSILTPIRSISCGLMQSPRRATPSSFPTSMRPAWWSAPGLILTAYHVLREDSDYWVDDGRTARPTRS